MVRVLHFSDIHIQAPLAELRFRDLFNKRFIGAANLALVRSKHFRRNEQKLAALARFGTEQGVDLVICTGDYTALGTEPELRAARAAVDPLTKARLGFVTVPGNHDIYLEDAVHDRRFERIFADVLHTDAPDLLFDETWPVVRLPADGIAVVAVNSARPNPQPWRSSGEISRGQLRGLDRVLADARLANRFIFVITHYAPRLADGREDRPWHGLTNATDFLRATDRVAHGAILHGHIHKRYHVRIPQHGLPMFGAGSATHEGHEGIWVYEVEADQARAIPGRWDRDRYVLDDRAALPITSR
jgi:3',5'-cyclic AMP phosphodiesterase CpdA